MNANRILGSQSKAVALSAYPVAVRSVARVRRIVGMPGRTVRLAGVRRRCPHAAKDVLAVRDGLHMRRIDASPVTAEVVDSQASRDRSAFQFIDGAVGTHHRSPAPACVDLPIAAAARGEPRPAFSRTTPFVLSNQTIREGTWQRWHMTQYSAVPVGAQ